MMMLLTLAPHGVLLDVTVLTKIIRPQPRRGQNHRHRADATCLPHNVRSIDGAFSHAWIQEWLQRCAVQTSLSIVRWGTSLLVPILTTFVAFAATFTTFASSLLEQALYNIPVLRVAPLILMCSMIRLQAQVTLTSAAIRATTARS